MRVPNLVRILFAAVFFAPAVALADPAPAPASAPAAAVAGDRIVVMISLDGLAGYYLDDPRAEMPTLRALAAAGARAGGMKTSTPSVTWPTHTSLVTGVHPARHGVVGNNYFDRARGARVTLIADPVYDKDQIVKVPTVYDLAKAKGLRTAAVRWPASRNAKTLDWTVPDISLDLLLQKYTTPSLLAESRAAGNWPGTEAKDQPKVSRDETWTRVFLQILRDHRPQLALLHLADIDHTEHVSGPKSDEAYAAIKEADGQVARVWEQLKRDYPGKATLVIVSDHGFSPITAAVLPNVVLRDAGLVETRDKKVVGGAVQLVPQGGSALVYVTDKANRQQVIDRVTRAFNGVRGIASVVGPGGLAAYGVADPAVDPNAPDMILFAQEGYVFGDTAAGALPVEEKSERRGSHGHDSNLPDLHATFIAWGVGIKPGARLGEISNTDVAPTVAKLLDVPMPNVDGKVLSAALSE